jgi:hypothetical protein
MQCNVRFSMRFGYRRQRLECVRVRKTKTFPSPIRIRALDLFSIVLREAGLKSRCLVLDV